MKKLILLLTLPLLAVTFNSCSNDDDGNENGTTKLVKRIIQSGGEVNAFEYDTQNRLIKYIWDEDGQVVDGKPWGGTANYITNTIVYEDNKMICTISDLLYPNSKDILTIYLDNAGYVTKIQTVEFTDDVETDRYNKTYTYKDGFLSTIVDAYPDEYYKENNYSGSFEWQNGNIIKATFLNGYEYVYEYTDIPNKFNVAGFFPHEWHFYLPAMKGTYSKNLPASCKEYYDGELDRSYTYTYTLDDDGYPTEIVRTYSDGDSYTTTLSYY